MAYCFSTGQRNSHGVRSSRFSSRRLLLSEASKYLLVDLGGEGVLGLLRLVNGNALILDGVLVMDFHELGDVHLGLLDELDLLDVDRLEGVDALARSLDLRLDLVHQQVLHESGERLGADLSLEDLDDFLTDSLNLSGLSVSEHGHLLILDVLGESNDKNTDDVTVGGLAVGLGLDEGMTLLDHLAHLITGQRETVKVSQAVLSLDFLNFELDLLVAILGLVEVSDVELADTSLESIGLNLLTLRLGDTGASDLGASSLEVGRSLDVVPHLLQEGIGLFLLLTLLPALGETLVLTICHVLTTGGKY